MSNEQHSIDVKNLQVHYESQMVLWDITFSLPCGAFIGVVGPNGAGKSTLLKALLSLIKLSAGKVRFWGNPYEKVRKKITYIPQRTSVDWTFPISSFELVLMGRYGQMGFWKKTTPEDIKAAEDALSMVGMLEYRQRQINKLSGGQQQRLFLARSLMQNADLYLLDEPFAGVDASSEKTIMQILVKLRNSGKTIVVVHHDLHTIDQYFDHLIMLNTCLVAAGPLEEVFTKENMERTFGKNAALLIEASRLSQLKNTGKITPSLDR